MGAGDNGEIQEAKQWQADEGGRKGAVVKGELQSVSRLSFSWNSLHEEGHYKVSLKTTQGLRLSDAGDS